MALILSVDGRPIEQEVRTDREVRFRLTLPVGEIRLLSSAARPADAGQHPDGRRMGVRVTSIRFQQGHAVFEAPVDSDAFVGGFHQLEQGRFRWTNGDALLPGVHIPHWQGEVDLSVSIKELIASSLPAVGRSQPTALDAFESLGLNCEFAFVQAHYHAAVPSGLLSWAGLGADKLIAGLNSRFAGLGDPGTTNIVWDRTEYLLNTPYFQTHTGRYDQVDAEGVEAIRRSGAARLRLLCRKLIKDIADARRIFVLKPRNATITPAETDDIYAALRRIGPAVLLSVSIAEPGEEGGSVERAGEGLYLGRLSKFVLNEGPYDEWRMLCERTLILHQSCLPPGSSLLAGSNPLAAPLP